METVEELRKRGQDLIVKAAIAAAQQFIVDAFHKLDLELAKCRSRPAAS